MILALTGATGFVGSTVLDQAVAGGHHVRALVRRPQPSRVGVDWITGALDNAPALDRLIADADAVVHVAGVVNAPDRAGFIAGNIEGTREVIGAAERAGVRRFIHVSSLSAREPELSTYGWSKHESERLVEASGLDWTIVRPTGVYGPRDTDMREMFRMARWGLALLPPPGRISLVAVEDLARLLVVLAEQGGPRSIWDVDDGSPGMTHAELARAIGDAVGHRVRPIHLPAAALMLAARIDRAVRGARAKLTPDRVGYLTHPDWTADPARRPPAALWTPSIETRDGLAATARWYRANGQL